MPGVREETRLDQSWSLLKPFYEYEEEVGRRRGVVILFCLLLYMFEIFHIKPFFKKECGGERNTEDQKMLCGPLLWLSPMGHDIVDQFPLSLFLCVSYPI